MYKPQRLIAGKLEQPITAYAPWVTVNDTLAALITLGAGDWTYFVIENGGEVEVVKVIAKIGSVLTIQRGQEGTTPTTFPAGALIYHVLTLSAVRDAVQTTALVLSATGIASVSNGTVHVAIPNVLGYGEIETVGRERAEIVDSHAFTGCKIVICGQVAFGPFYLTSKLYPIEVIDALKSVAPLVGMQIITHPLDLLGSISSIVAATLRQIYKDYTIPVEELKSLNSIVEATLRQILLSYTIPHEELQSSNSIVSATLQVILITYSNWPPEELKSVSSIVGVTLV